MDLSRWHPGDLDLYILRGSLGVICGEDHTGEVHEPTNIGVLHMHLVTEVLDDDLTAFRDIPDDLRRTVPRGGVLAR